MRHLCILWLYSILATIVLILLGSAIQSWAGYNNINYNNNNNMEQVVQVEQSTKERNDPWDDICDNYQLDTDSKHQGEGPHYRPMTRPRERKKAENIPFPQEYFYRKMHKGGLDSFKANVGDNIPWPGGRPRGGSYQQRLPDVKYSIIIRKICM